MRVRRWVPLIALLALLGSSLPALVSAEMPAELPAAAAIAPTILEGMGASLDGRASFFVLFREQADLSPAYQIADWHLRGQFVYDALRLTAERSQRRVRTWLEERGIVYEAFPAGNRLFITADEAVLNQLAAFPEVAAFRGNPLYALEPTLPGPAGTLPEGVTWNIAQVGADQVWADLGVRGQGILVANIDTGVEFTHFGLYINYRCAASPHDNCWYDPEDSCPGDDPCDDNGHGTHVMGVMVADDYVGLPYTAGMAPDAQWIACKGCTNMGCTEYALTACGDWMLAPNGDPANRPHVVNNSWGGQGCDSWYLPYVQAWLAAGIFPAFSPGGSGPSCGSVGSPADYPASFATGATDQNDLVAPFSPRGPSCWGQIKPDVVAPGVQICTTDLGNTWTCNHSGTSFSSPHSAGLVALLWSAEPALIGDIASTRQVITSTALCIEDLGCGGNPCPGGNNVAGWGRIDAYAAVASVAAYGHLEGTASEWGTGTPIAGAEVVAERYAGGSYSAFSDPSGYYTASLPAGTYTVTASAYGYFSETVYGVQVITDQVTTQDFSLNATPQYVVSGTVSEAGSGAPLHARVSVLEAPIPAVWTDPASGFYSVTVASGTYTFMVTATLHVGEQRAVVADHDQSQDFALEPLPCVLLVDDDGDGPDVRSYYTTALDDLGIGYNVWDVLAQGDPAAGDLAGYPMVLWFNGSSYSSTFSEANEAAVGAYLDAGGRFFLSSQDYLYDAGLTPFGQSYLHIASYDSDVSQTTVTGQNPYAGLGPYSLSYPFTNYSDEVNPDGQGVVAFVGNQGNAAVAYEGASFHTVFFGFPFEAIPDLADRSEVIETTVAFFGGCECTPVSDPGFGWTPPTPAEGEEVTFSGTASGTLPIAFEWDFGDGITGTGQVVSHTYAAAGEYPVVMTATNGCGGRAAVYTVTVVQPCAAVEILSVTAEISGCQASFSAGLTGTSPFEWLWAFGDGMTSTLEMPVYEYGGTGVYTATLKVWNCGGQYGAEESFVVVVEACMVRYEIYFPVVSRGY